MAGGVIAVSRATGLPIDTIRKGIAELSLRDTELDAPVEARLRIRVYHFPPGASKWNKIEHRIFAHITQN